MKLVKRCIVWLKKIVKGIMSFIFVPIIFLIAFLSRFVKRKYDIGIGPVPLINNVYYKQALEALGYSVQTFASEVYFITSDFDWIMTQGGKLIKKYPLFRVFPVLFRYKCLYINYNGCVLGHLRFYKHLEAYIYKVARIKVLVMPYGADVQITERTPNLYFRNSLYKDYPTFFKTGQKKILWSVTYWCKHADAVIGMGDMIDFLNYWDYLRTSTFCVNLEKLVPDPQFEFCKNGVVHILHAPNHKTIKGSSFVEEAIHRLQQEGYQVDYIMIQKKTNAEVMEAIKRADIVVDQIIIGWHGIFALESMAFGKPTITHIRPDLLMAFEETGCIEKGELPLIDARPTTIYDVLRDLLDHPDKMTTIGKNSRAYVEKYHSLEAVGKFFDEINRKMGIIPTRN